jgi:hypothetical protein
MAEFLDIETQDGTRIPVAPLDETVGATGSILTGGRFTDEEFNKALKPFKARGSQADHGIFDKMRRTDATINGVLLSQELPLRAAEWVVEPPENPSDLERRIADEVADNLFTRIEGGWDGFLQQAMLFLQYGFMLFERVYQRTPAGRHRLRKLAPRMPWSVYRWVEDENGSLVGITQRVKKGGSYQNIVLPATKTLLMINRLEGGNWEGISAIRQAYGPWLKKDEIDRRDLINYERFGSGLPVFQEPPNFNPADPQWKNDLDRVAEIGRNLRAHQKSYVQVPRGWTFDVKFPTGSGLPVGEKQRYYDHQILLNSLAMLMDLGNTETGSRALGETFADLFLHGLRGHARVVEAALNGVSGLAFTGVIPELVHLNYGPQTRYPRVLATKLSSKAVTSQLPGLSKAVETGLLAWGSRDEEVLRDWLDLPSTPHQVEQSRPNAPESRPNREDDDGVYALRERSRNKAVTFEDADGRSHTAWRRPAGVSERVVSWASIDDALRDARYGLGPLVAPAVGQALEEYRAAAAPLIEEIQGGVTDGALVARLASLPFPGRDEIRAGVRAHIGELVESSREFVWREQYRQEINEHTKASDPVLLQVEEATAATSLLAALVAANESIPTGEKLRLLASAQEYLATQKILATLEGATADLAVQDALTGSAFLTQYAAPLAEGTTYSKIAGGYTQAVFSEARADGVRNWVEGGGKPVQMVRFTALLDSAMCEPCGDEDGNRYPMGGGDYQVNKPPFHRCSGWSSCRCMYIYESAAAGSTPVGEGVFE